MIKFNPTIKIEKFRDWDGVVDAARCTSWKGELGHEPSDKFKRDLLNSHHKPLQEVWFVITIENIPSFVAMQLRTYGIGVQSYTSSSRSDNQNVAPREEQHKTDLCNFRIGSINAMALVHMMHQRLCSNTELETRWLMNKILEELYKVDAMIAKYCVRQCVFLGRCPEPNPKCSYYLSAEAHMLREQLFDRLM